MKPPGRRSGHATRRRPGPGCGSAPGRNDPLRPHYCDLSDEMLHRACLERDTDALAELVRRFSGLVRHIAARYVRDPEERDELHQEVFLAVCHPRTLESLRDGARLRFFIAAVTRNKCRDRFRSVRERVGLDEADLPIIETKTPEAFWDLERAFDRLPATKTVRLGMEMIRLRYWEGRSYREIGRRLGVPVGSIGPTLNRLFDAVRSMLEGDGAGPDVSGRTRRPTGSMEGEMNPSGGMNPDE